MKPQEQVLYEQFAKETSPYHYLPWDQLPDLVKISWKHVLETAKTGQDKNDMD